MNVYMEAALKDVEEDRQIKKIKIKFQKTKMKN